MRLRYMELPSEVVGEFVRTPFVLVFDQCTDAEGDKLNAESADIASAVGARAALAFGGRVDLDGDQPASTAINQSFPAAINQSFPESVDPLAAAASAGARVVDRLRSGGMI